MKVTQEDRVLGLLRLRGEHGVDQSDFNLPDIVDGGPPITRLAARILDLRRRGFVIKEAGTRKKFRVYRLVLEPAAPVPDPGEIVVEPLFIPASAPRSAIFDFEEDEAA